MFLEATYVEAHEGARVVSKAIIVVTGVAADAADLPPACDTQAGSALSSEAR